MATATRRRSPRVLGEVRRDEILEAAQTCFRDQGYYRTTVDDIAARARLSKGAIYWHFKGKRELFFALFDRYLESFEAYARVAGEAPSAPDALRRMVEVLAEGEAETLELIELQLEYMSHASRDPDLRRRYREMYQRLRSVIGEQIERGIRDGDFRSVDPTSAASVVVGTLDALIFQKVLEPDLELLPLWKEAIELVLKGIHA
jgi:TetR/AcrR family acrAB operon transcriptional repressor